jgi:hypothetical protein
MAALTWTTLLETVTAALVQAPYPYNAQTADFNTLFPQATSYAEGRIYKDLILLATRTQTTGTATAGSRSLDLNTLALPLPMVVEGVAMITPPATPPAAGYRTPFDKVTLDAIDLIWPDEALVWPPSQSAQIGRYWAMRDDHTIVYCPTPDAGYTVEVTGLFQPLPISAENPTTYLATTYPELLTAAVMIWMTGALLRNFGSQADDPKMAMSWEGTYQELKTIATNEELRRRGLAPDFVAPKA